MLFNPMLVKLLIVLFVEDETVGLLTESLVLFPKLANGPGNDFETLDPPAIDC